MIRMKGMAATAVMREPPTSKAQTKKPKTVIGRRSSLDPISALNRLRRRPLGFVSKKSIFSPITALAIASKLLHSWNTQFKQY